MIFTNKNSSPKTIPIVENFGNIIFENEIAYFNTYVEEDAYNVISQHMISTYKSLKENNVYILEEGFNDFIQGVVKFFKELIGRIVDFAKRAYMYISSFIGDFSKFLDKYKNKLTNIDRSFDTTGYVFTFVNSPIVSEMDTIINDFNNSLTRMDNMTMADVVKMRDGFADPSYQDTLRASIIGQNDHELDSEKFMLKIKGLFRNGDSEPVKIHVDKRYINTIINEYANTKRILNDTIVTKNKILKSLDTMQTFFQRKAQVAYNNENKIVRTHELQNNDGKVQSTGDRHEYAYNYDKLKIMNMYYDYMFRRSKFISSCITNVYFEKVRAYKDCLSQYRSFTRIALFGRDDAVKEKKDGEEK